jgi:integrase/recombinase XerD
LEEADAITVEDWLAELDEYYTNASSVGKASAALVAAYEELNKLIDAGRIDANGWRTETPPQRASYSPKDKSSHKARESREDLHYLKPDQVNELAEATKTLRNELIVRLLFQTGCRVSELCHIRVKDIDPEERSIKIRGKGRKNRTVYYQETLDLLMDVWITEEREAVYHSEDSAYLFPTSYAEKITRQTVNEIVRDTAEVAGLQDVYGTNTDGRRLHSTTAHTLRHSFAMSALDRGWDVYTLSQALGHESTEITTSTYLHDDELSVRKAYFERGPRELAE